MRSNRTLATADAAFLLLGAAACGEKAGEDDGGDARSEQSEGEDSDED